MSRVLVTGAPGFVGAAATRALLEQGDEVAALIQPGTSDARLAGLRLHSVTLDLDDRAGVARALADLRPEVILHAAWYANPADYLTSPFGLTSLRNTLDLMDSALQAGCPRFVGIGTCLEYARSDRPLREDSPCDPRTLYAACKLSAFHLCRALAAQAGVSLAWARLFYLYGPDENPGRLLPALVGTLRARRPFAMTAGQQVRDYLHIDDAGRALALLCRSPAEGAVNVASGQPTPLRDFAATVAGLLDARELLRPGELPTRPDEEMYVVADVTRLNGLGFVPRYATLAAGLGHALENWRTP
jgi:nucleoside-diphosphate-sugar epimerase